MGLTNKVDMVYLSPVGYGVQIQPTILVRFDYSFNNFQYFCYILYGANVPPIRQLENRPRASWRWGETYVNHCLQLCIKCNVSLSM